MWLDICMYLFNKCQRVHKYELKTNLFDTCKVDEHEKKTYCFMIIITYINEYIQYMYKYLELIFYT